MPDRSHDTVAEHVDDTDESVVSWLLDGDPAIRWQVERDLLDAPAGDVATERARVATTGWGRRLLELQDPEGTWAGGLYTPKWTSTTYTLLLLRHCGLDPANERARRGVRLLWDGARDVDGGLTSAKTVPFPEACVTSMYLALAYYFDLEHPRIESASEWLLQNRLADGGWNCRNVRFGDRHSSFHTSILALEALDEIHRRQPERTDVVEAMSAGRAFFLAHRLFRSHRTGAVADPAFTRLSFPPRWHYDLLRGLDHAAVTDAPWDERYEDAFAILDERRRPDGTWPSQNRHAGRVWFDFERGGTPSRWNTLRALRALRWRRRSAAR